MATATAETETKREERMKRVMVGELPGDFLRLPDTTNQQQVEADEQTAILLQQQYAGAFFPANVVGRCSITVVEAKLNKNYGVTRMDPYCRLRVGHSVYETHTDHNGAKNPRWNKAIQCYLPTGVTNFYLEIFDECAFSMDERIAWAHITIPENVVKNSETVDDWYQLNGKQGDGREGTVNLVISFTPMPVGNIFSPTAPTPVVMVPTPPIYGYPFYTGPQQMVNGGPRPFTEEDLKQMQEMFPETDPDIVKSVLEAKGGNKESAANALLQMAAGN